MSAIRVLLVDDHAVLRATLSERLDREETISVVGTARDADEAVEFSTKLTPDIVLADIDMPGPSGFAAARRIADVVPGVRFIFLSAFTSDHYIEEALSVGAMGYLTKGESPETIVEAVHAVFENRSRFSAEIRNRIIVDDSGLHRLQGTTRASSLSAREREVLRFIAHGLSKKEICQMMHVSINTIDKHTTNLMRKLNVHDRVELTRFAIREGIAAP